MSNKIVPSIYRAVIDEVIASIRPEFEEYGVPEDVLAELQHKWEDKVIASRVADFEPVAPAAPPATQYPPHPHHQMAAPYLPHSAYAPPPPSALPQSSSSTSPVKSEPVDSRHILNHAQYTLPLLPGPQLSIGTTGRPNPLGQTSILSFPPGPPTSNRPPSVPQVDGPSDDSEDSSTPPPTAYAPRTLHPSLPQPLPVASTSAPVDSEAINSDLDDSDTEDEDLEEASGANADIVFCTYDKVARVKSKWKCILKDGMIHANGKDYLFSRCTGEFDWV